MYRRIPPNEVRVGIVPAFRKLPLTKKRYIFAQGGRGGGKSIAVADDLLLKSCNEKAIFLCTREVQKSIKDSVMSLLKERIEVLNLSSIFDITGTEIRNLRTGSTFIFAGLKEHTIDSIKSYANVKYCWVEEAHSVSKKSLDYLTPTIRVPDAQIYFTFNKFSEADPVAIRWNREMTETRKFQVRTDDGKIYTWTEHSGDDAYGVFINYDGNPYFPPALYRDMLKDKEEDYEYYLHIWEGQALNQSDTAVLSRKMVLKAMRVKTGEPDFDDWKFGIDVARFGDDRTQFYLANKYKVIASKTMRKLDTVQVTMKAIEFLEDNIEYGPDQFSCAIKIDDTGLGGGVTDQLEHKGYNVIPVIFGGSPNDKAKYDMAMSEMWFNFKDKLKAKDITMDIPHDLELLEELVARQYTYDRTEKRCIEEKKKYKERLGRSPDKADALLLTFYDAEGYKYESMEIFGI